jgi:hypothetical protein
MQGLETYKLNEASVMPEDELAFLNIEDVNNVFNMVKAILV